MTADFNKNTKILLIGNSVFPKDKNLASIPNVRHNIQALEKLFLDNTICNISKTNIWVALDFDRTKLELTISQFLTENNKIESKIIIYYAGHGLLNKRGDFGLFFSTNDTIVEHLESTALKVDSLKQHLRDRASKTKQKILILDCCFSGKFFDGLMGGDEIISAKFNQFEGAYIITSTNQDTAARFDPLVSTKPTFFTEKLIDVINNGVNNDKTILKIGDVFDKIYNDIDNNPEIPLPQNLGFLQGREIEIALNRAFINKRIEEEKTRNNKKNISSRRKVVLKGG